MERNNQTPSDDASSAGKIQARVPCVLLFDVSNSMSGEPIEKLNAGLVAYKINLARYAKITRTIDLAVVAFGGEAHTLCGFTTAEEFHPPQLVAGGGTPLGEAIHQGIDLLQDQKQAYWSRRIPFHRPWVFLISASAATDSWRSAAGRIRHGETSRAFSLFAVGVDGADFENLRGLTTRAPLQLKALRFKDFFKWLADSQRALSQAAPGERVSLPNPAAADGWAVAGPREADTAEARK